ncbi:hypothetical protein [Vogesella sp. LIG4]|uniref:hypothetical protein n=1 Tax=Vogesella sp. LIG4 TaxID=1192162 RepID=UPI0008201CD7|nr:hypothetical protein [Vogesella sp. LIG4]SCK24534.1 hypothetical protein PSELUDRAFT_2887 [Vogesella sp. LIG4]
MLTVITSTTRAKLFVAVLASGFVMSTAFTPASQAEETPDGMSAQTPRPAPAKTTPQAPATAHRHSPYHAVSMPNRARIYYSLYGGIDNVRVQRTASDNLIRVSYRVTDPARARELGDKKVTPYLLGLRSHAVLQVPVMDKIGPLRQSGSPEMGKEYWMVFSNKGNLVKTGDRVNVVIGSFHMDGLAVE